MSTGLVAVKITRRAFSQLALSTAGISGTLNSFAGGRKTIEASLSDPGFGPLVKDRKQILDLPKGFSYRVISRMGEKMSDGFYVPGFPDGMGAFPGPDGLTLILRNHEFRAGDPPAFGPFKGRNRLMKRIPPELIYDQGGKDACLGSVTTLVYDTRSRKLHSQFLSLVGTLTNCSGGRTPYGSWLSCEESCETVADGFSENHGYAFEVAVSSTPDIVNPEPLRSMGRFVHEGIAFDRKTGIAYLTEDQQDSLLYRYIPENPQDLRQGGRLQALALVNEPRFDTRNWKERTLNVGERARVRWTDLDNVDPPQDDLRKRGLLRGAALFARGEGICCWGDSISFVSTNGGLKRKGQLWRYWPSSYEGTDRESEKPASLELSLESEGDEVLGNPDQACETPWGDLLVCEDGTGEQFVRGITPEHAVYDFARNARDDSELTGVCFSPDDTTLFVNNLKSGLTLAVTGPWKSRG